MNTTIYYCSPNVGKFENNNLFYPSLIESGGKVTNLLGQNEKFHSSDKFSNKAKERIKHESLNTLFISFKKKKITYGTFFMDFRAPFGFPAVIQHYIVIIL